MYSEYEKSRMARQYLAIKDDDLKEWCEKSIELQNKLIEGIKKNEKLLEKHEKFTEKFREKMSRLISSRWDVILKECFYEKEELAAFVEAAVFENKEFFLER